MTKHTPGPWRVVAVDWSGDGNARFEIKGITRTGLADARLIAAAPELLAVLKAALPLLHTSDELPMNYFADKPGVLGEALRIIAKIEGELK